MQGIVSAGVIEVETDDFLQVSVPAGLGEDFLLDSVSADRELSRTGTNKHTRCSNPLPDPIPQAIQSVRSTDVTALSPNESLFLIRDRQSWLS